MITDPVNENAIMAALEAGALRLAQSPKVKELVEGRVSAAVFSTAEMVKDTGGFLWADMEIAIQDLEGATMPDDYKRAALWRVATRALIALALDELIRGEAAVQKDDERIDDMGGLTGPDGIVREEPGSHGYPRGYAGPRR